MSFYAANTLLFAFATYLRIAQIRELALPAWVDSVHHTAIIRLLVEQGTLPATYAPYAPDTFFFYHWGFHAIVAWCAWLLQQTEPLRLAQLLLHLGQFFNLLSVLLVYTGARLLLGNSRAGFYAALFAGVVSWFPMYYVAWGRYTELVGLLLVPILLYRVWSLRRQPTAGAIGGVALLAGGLFLIHIRVTVFVLVFCLLLLSKHLLQRDWQTLRSWLLAGGLTVLMVAPWLYQLLVAHELQQRWGLVRHSAGAFLGTYSPVAWSYLLVPNNRELMAVASAGLSALLTWRGMARGGLLLAVACFGLTVYASYRQPRMALRLMRIYTGFGVYLLALALALNLHWIGLPTLGFVSNDSALLAAFLPLTILAGGLCSWVLCVIMPARFFWPLALLCTLLVGPLGLWQLRSLVPLTTVFATNADLQAFRWIEEQLPLDAKFAVNLQPWIGNTYVGEDGGYWLPLLTNRRSILPIALYTSNGSETAITHTNALLTAWAGHTGPDDQLMKLLVANDVTHIYIGARPGHLRVEQLRANPTLHQIYAHDGVFIFALADD